MPGGVLLDGNFAPVAAEITATDLDVTGAIPPQLAGRYIRTGPNPFSADPDTYHWFAGDGMVHGVDLHDGQARWYRNRWVRSPEVSAHLGEEPVPREEGGWYPGSGNTNVFAHGGRILAVTEGSLPYELDVDLETVAARNLGGPLPAGINAHPKFDPDTGEMHVMSYGFGKPAMLHYNVVGASGALERTVEIELPAPVFVHDMGLTASHAVIFDLPVLFEREVAGRGEQMPFRWHPENGARVGLLPRHGGGSADVVWLEVEPCWVYHPLNAYDENGTVVIDLVVHDSAFVGDGYPAGRTSRLERWNLHAHSGAVKRETIDERSCEFPRADERLTARRHRYGYTVGGATDTGMDALGSSSAIRKHDQVAGTTTAFEFGPGRIASEMVFVPDTAASGEDDGWLMGYVYDATRDASDLVIIDAHDFGAPVATVHLPARVPQGFHGNWISDASLGLTD